MNWIQLHKHLDTLSDINREPSATGYINFTAAHTYNTIHKQADMLLVPTKGVNFTTVSTRDTRSEMFDLRHHCEDQKHSDEE